MFKLLARPHRAALLLSPALFACALVACGGSDQPGPATGATTGTGAGGDGSGGTGGAGGAIGDVMCELGTFPSSARPACTKPGMPSATPPPRADTAGVLANDGCTFLLFGGDTALPVCGQNPKHTHAGDTWLLDAGCGSWVEITGAAPSARARHAMALDPVRNQALLFGGRSRKTDTGAYTLYHDVWAFDFNEQTWSEVATTGPSPSARSNAAAVVSNDMLFVFGGSTSTSGLSFTPKNDLYALDLASHVWTKVNAAGTLPEARLFHAMAADPTMPRLFVYSGGDANAFVGPFFTDLWSLDIATSTWHALTPKKGDTDGSGRIKLGLLARAPGEGQTGPMVAAFGGHDDGILGNRNDVIEADLGAAAPAWSSALAGDVYNAPSTGACKFPADFVKTDLESPERRSAFAFGARSDGKAFVIVGGDSDCGRLSDAWWFDADQGSWSPIRSTLPGLTCPRTGSMSCTSLCGGG